MNYNEILYLTKEEVMKVDYTMQETLDILEEIYREKAAGNYELPAKIGIHPGVGNYMHAMPCWAHKWEAAGIKWGAAFKENPKKGIDYIHGFIVLNDVMTGVPYSIMDCAWITAQRTGAKNGFAAKYLAKKDASVLAVLACGVQARKALHAIHLACPGVKKVLCWDYFPEATKRYVDEMKAQFPELDIIPCASPAEALKDADIIQTAAPTTQTEMSIVTSDMIKPGAVIVAMDGFTLFHKECIEKHIKKFITDDIPQYKNFSKGFEYKGIVYENAVELCDVVAGKVPGRENDEEVIFVSNIGNAFDDMPIAKYVYERAEKMGLGIKVPR